MIYEIVTTGGAMRFNSAEEVSREMRTEIAGVETSTSLREELRGAPKFEGLCGPMYGGPGKIRYETWEAYKIYSR